MNKYDCGFGWNKEMKEVRLRSLILCGLRLMVVVL